MQINELMKFKTPLNPFLGELPTPPHIQLFSPTRMHNLPGTHASELHNLMLLR